MKRIVIIGGGITGLAAAHRLMELSHELHLPLEIKLLEASGRVGGTLQTDTRDGFLLERGPDSFISEKPQGIELARRLGIESRLIETNKARRRSFIVRNGRLRPVPQGFQLLAPSSLFPFLTSSIFSVSGKVRMAADLVLPRKKMNADDETLADFVRRRLGDEALARMAQPMVGGIYTADPEKLSLRATFPRFLDMEARHRSIILAMFKGKRSSRAENAGTSGARYSLFLSFDTGMQLLVDTLERRISDLNSSRVTCEIKLNLPVQTLRRIDGGRWNLVTAKRDSVPADAICLALPAHTAATLLSETSPQLAAELSAIPYASTATINFGYRRQDIPHRLDGFGFVVPYVERRSLLACTFASVKFPRRAPEDCVLLRAFVGGALQPDMFALEDVEMISRVRNDFRELLGIQTAPLFAEVSKWSKSMPQYELGHLDRVQRIADGLRELPGIKVAGNAFYGAGIPDCIRSGEQAAKELIEQ
jgi:oxygen-dependent protoporphyrinogen oxidase